MIKLHVPLVLLTMVVFGVHHCTAVCSQTFTHICTLMVSVWDGRTRGVEMLEITLVLVSFCCEQILCVYVMCVCVRMCVVFVKCACMCTSA